MSLICFELVIFKSLELFNCFPNCSKCVLDDGSSQVIMDGQETSLTVTELEKLFGLPEHYTDVLDLSPRQRQSLLGKSWSVPVIQNILEPLKEFFFMEWEECLNEDEPSSSNHRNRQQQKDEDESSPMICHKRRKHVDEPGRFNLF